MSPTALSFPAAAHPRHAVVWAQVEGALVAGELAHDRFHIQRVYAWAMRLAGEAGVSADLAGATALVHDLSVIPKDSALRPQAGERAAVLARPVLAQAGYAADEVDHIVEAVRTSSWSRGLQAHSPLAQLLQDADRLDALGAVGLLRLCACAQHMSQAQRPGRFYHPEDPLAQTERPLDDRTNAMDHCYAKLLRLASGMHLPSARTEAERRQAVIRGFLDELGLELSGEGLPLPV